MDRAWSSLISLNLRLGVNLTRRAASRDVVGLVGQLRPVSTGHPLVRLGADGDGGYLVPDDLAGLGACFSPGVAAQASFEADLIRRGVRCYLADGSVPASPLAPGAGVHFTPKHLGVSDTRRTITMESWISSTIDVRGGSAHDADLILQMDVEGDEWEILPSLPDSVLRRFRIIVVELHCMERAFDRVTCSLMSGTIGRLLRYFRVAHVHPNNYGGLVICAGVALPRVLELTLLRKDRVEATRPIRRLPHREDRPNSPRFPDIDLPALWYVGPDET